MRARIAFYRGSFAVKLGGCTGVRRLKDRLAKCCLGRGPDFTKQLTCLAARCIVALMLSKELVAASTVPLVLSVLAEGENYGYALIQRVREPSEGQIQWAEGMLSPVVHWMEAQEFIVSEWRAGESGRRRKYYRLRQRGQKALNTEKQQW